MKISFVLATVTFLISTGVISLLGDLSAQKAGLLATAKTATAIVADATAVKAEALAAAQVYDDAVGKLFAAGSCSPEHPLPKGVKTEAEYLVTDAAIYCRQQSVAAINAAIDWKHEAEMADNSISVGEVRRDKAMLAIAQKQKIVNVSVGAMSVALVSAIAMLITTILMALKAVVSHPKSSAYDITANNN